MSPAETAPGGGGTNVELMGTPAQASRADEGLIPGASTAEPLAVSGASSCIACSHPPNDVLTPKKMKSFVLV